MATISTLSRRRWSALHFIPDHARPVTPVLFHKPHGPRTYEFFLSLRDPQTASTPKLFSRLIPNPPSTTLDLQASSPRPRPARPAPNHPRVWSCLCTTAPVSTRQPPFYSSPPPILPPNGTLASPSSKVRLDQQMIPRPAKQDVSMRMAIRPPVTPPSDKGITADVRCCGAALEALSIQLKKKSPPPFESKELELSTTQKHFAEIDSADPP